MSKDTIVDSGDDVLEQHAKDVRMVVTFLKKIREYPYARRKAILTQVESMLPMTLGDPPGRAEPLLDLGPLSVEKGSGPEANPNSSK